MPACGWYIGGTVQAINLSLIKDWSRVDPRLQNAAWHTVNGKHYGVPYQWGSNVLMYNNDAFGGTAPTSWNVVFRGDDAAGRQVEQGPRAGLLRPDLHCRRRRCT